jgi:hypothetical protein
MKYTTHKSAGAGARTSKNLNNNPMAQQKAGPLTKTANPLANMKKTTLAMKAQKAGPLKLK